MDSQEKHIWTKEEIEILKRDYPKYGPDIKELSYIESKKIRHKANKLGLLYRNARSTWSDEDIEILKREYKNYGTKIPALSHYSTSSIRHKAASFGLKFSNRYEDKTGEIKTMKSGEKAEIIKYINNRDITVLFDDAITKEHLSYANFKKGILSSTGKSMKSKRIGMCKMMNCGMEAKIIAYNNANDMTVSWENGEITEHCQFHPFNKGTMRPKSLLFPTRLGEIKMMNCGMEAKIVRYGGSQDVDIKFTDGTLLKHRLYDQFAKGTIQNPKLTRKYSLDNDPWSNEDLAILKREYPEKGCDIESLKKNHSKSSIQHKASRLGIKNIKNRWSNEETEILKKYYATMGTNIPELKHRKPRQIVKKAMRLGLKADIPIWTEDEEHILKEKYETCGTNIPELKHRSKSAIMSRASKLGLKSSYNASWPDEEIEILKTKYPIMKHHIPELSHRSKQAICHTASRLGIKYEGEEKDIPWTEEEKTILMEEYPIKGAHIKSLSYRSRQSISSMAFIMGLKCVFSGPLNNGWKVKDLVFEENNVEYYLCEKESNEEILTLKELALIAS